jgi:GT2 family glycosyltransferase
VIVFPAVADPVVSIIIVTYGGWEWVAEALVAIVENTPPCYEVIIVDNASPDGTGDEIERSVGGATIVRNRANVGFGPGANQGALHAVARYLFFLNSDAFPQPGWLPPLLDVLEGDARAGAAAPCLVDPDGTLQEAGGLLGEDGFAVQYGLGADAGRFEYRFRRRCDYASAAALLVRRRDFVAVGGFDPAYGLGYFEDVDLCLELWERGLATVCEPRSRVVHLRGASTHPEESQARSILSHAVFVRRWGERLAFRTSLADTAVYPHRVAASRDARSFDRILVLEPAGSGEDRASAPGLLAAELSEVWHESRVTLLTTDGPVPADVVPRLLAQGVEIASEDRGPEAWLGSRRFHYSIAVLRGLEAFDWGHELLRRFQPQVLRVLDVGQGLDGGTLSRSVGDADLVLCATEDQRRAVAAIKRCLPVFVIPGSPGAAEPGLRRRALVRAMAEVGLAPQDCRVPPDRLPRT